MQGEDVANIPRRDVQYNPEDRCIGDEAKTVVKHLVTKALTILVEELLDDILRTSYNNTPRGICLVVSIVVEQVVLDVLREEVIGKTLDVHPAKPFDANGSNDKLFKNILTLRTFMERIATFVHRETYSATANQNSEVAKTSTMDLVAATDAYRNNIASSPSRSNLASEEPQNSRSLRPR